MQPRVHGQFAGPQEIDRRKRCKAALKADLIARGLLPGEEKTKVAGYLRKRSHGKRSPSDFPLLMEADHAA